MGQRSMKNILILFGVFLLSISTFSQVEYVSTGGAGAYSLSHPSNISSLTNGLSFTFKANHVNPGASSLTVNGYSASIKKGVGTDLDPNDILAGQVVTVVYDGANFQMTTPIGNVAGGGSMTLIEDADGDTEINVEVSPDQDIIHFFLGDNAGYPGGEYFRMVGPRLDVLGSGNSVFIGEGAGSNDNLASNGNVFIGTNSGAANFDGQNNVAVGINTMQAHTSGYNNTAIGSVALYSTTTGTHNTALGSDALYLNTTGTGNLAVGYQALGYNTSASGNVAVGQFALRTNDAGNFGTAIGYNSMQYAFNGTASFTNQNVAVGYMALRGSVNPASNSGNGNTSVGFQTMMNNTIGGQNVALGSSSLFTNNSGSYNVALGVNTQYNNTSGSSNVAIGYNALYSNSLGNSNVAVGQEALLNSTGNSNNAFGYRALQNTTVGVFNSAFGYETLRYNTTSHRNTGFGSGALINSTGANNTGLGADAGVTLTSGDNNTFLGKGADAGSSNLSNATAVGANAVVAQSNSLVLGGTGANAVNVGIGTTVPAYALDVNGNTRVGYLGNSSVITIYPSDFLSEEGGATDYLVMQTNNTGSVFAVNSRGGSSALLAIVRIPVGYKATEVEVWGNSPLTGVPFEVYEVSLIDGSFGANLSGGSGVNTGAYALDTAVGYNPDYYMIIKIEAGGDYLTGAKVSISPL